METILIYRIGSLGDTLVALPCFIKIRDSFPNNKIILLTNNPISPGIVSMKDILEPTFLIDEFIEYQIGIKNFYTIFKLLKKISLTHSVTLIYLVSASNKFRVIRDFLFFYLSGIKKILGLPLSKSLLYGHYNESSKKIECETSRLSRTILKLGYIDLNDNYYWDLKFTSEEINIATSHTCNIRNNNFFVINMGGKAIEKDWGIDNWKSLILALSQKYGYLSLITIGSTFDFQRAEEVLGKWPNSTINLCGKLSSRESGCVISKADFFIGHDSGPLHLAALVKTPTIGLFGNYNHPSKWHPYGLHVSIIHEMRGIDLITVEDVIYELNKLLNN